MRLIPNPPQIGRFACRWQWKRPAGRLNHATMDSIRRLVVGLIEEPNPFPLEQDVPQIVGREDQLVRATYGISRINREEAPAVRSDGDA